MQKAVTAHGCNGPHAGENLEKENEGMIEEITAILALKPGEMLVYHRGNLAKDRGTGLKPEHRTAETERVNEIGNIAWKLYQEKKITLVQRRVEPGVMDYLAVRLS